MRLFLSVVVTLVVLLMSFCGMLVYSWQAAPKMFRDSDLALDKFYQRSKVHNYAGAHQMLTRRLQSQVSEQTLTQQWKTFEAAHGPIKSWLLASNTSNRINLWPRYVNSTLQLKNKKSGTVTARLRPEGKNWRIDQLTIAP